jgi:hypothetical protein
MLASPASLLLAFLAAALALPAQELTVQNLAPYPRAEWVAAVVPFAQGAVATVPDLHVEEHATVWQPIGARWPDGSLRQAVCLFRPQLARLGERQLALVAGPGPAAPQAEIGLPDARFVFQVERGGELTETEPTFVEWLEHNAARRVALLRARLGTTGLVAELILERWADQEHGSADVAVFFSDPTTQAMECAVQRLSVQTTGMAWVVRHGPMLGATIELLADGSRVTLLRDVVLGDGQGIRRSGALVPALRGGGAPADLGIAAAAICPPLAATSWTASGAFGPFGFVPEIPPWLRGNGLRNALAARHRRFVADAAALGEPLRNLPFGLARFAGQTGDQEDFGIVKLEPVAASGLPSFLLEVEPSVLQEACRPVHFFEADGAPVLPSAHPDWVVWSGRTHWHCSISTDRLGKPCPEPRFQTHGWTGKDRQHWSSNYLTAFYLLTGKHWTLREIDNEVRLYLAGQTVKPGLTTSGPDAPRGAGRTLLAACWLYQCTGDAALLQRMNERLDNIYWPGWVGRELAEDRVRPMGWSGPDGRLLDGQTASWAPWQDSIAAVGFEAAYRTTGNPRARELAAGLALNCLRHGWRVDDRSAIIATAVRWVEGGAPPSDEELASGARSVVQWSTGTGFSMWAIGAVELARQFAAQRGEPELQQKAERILALLRAHRGRPRDNWFDRFGEWDAVR